MNTTTDNASRERRSRAWVLWLPGLAVAIGAGVATAHGLFEVAADAGVPAGLAWLYPVMTDGLALVAYVSTIRLTETADRAYAWAVVVLAAGLSGLAQAAYLAGGVGGDPKTDAVLRFGVGAWPAVAAAIVAHLLFLIARVHSDPSTTRTHHQTDLADRAVDVPGNTEQRPVDAHVSMPGVALPDTDATVEGSGVQRELFNPAVRPAVQAEVQASVQRPVQSGVQGGGVQPSKPVARSNATGLVAGAREQARVVARRFAREHERLPTVSELQQAAEVSRGSAHSALKDLKAHPSHLHIVNAEQEAAQQ